VRHVISVLTVVAFAAVSVGRGQAPPMGPPAVRIDQAAGPPGGLVNASFYLVRPADQIGAIAVDVVFQNRFVSFVKAELSGIAEGADAHLTVLPKATGTNKTESTIQLKLSTIEEGGSKQPLPVGGLVRMQFKISDAAKPGTVVDLKVSGTVRKVAAPQTTTNVNGAPGQVIVSEKSIISCFFYMH